MHRVHPVILSGGTGSRLWPLSRSQSPKQLLRLVGKRTLIQDTVLRVNGPNFLSPTVVCQESHRFVIAEQLREAGVGDATLLLEPAGRNTAPAAALAALTIYQKDPDALLLILPADHVVRAPEAFQAALQATLEAAISGKLVTFGIVPNYAETGYGYIQRGTPLPDSSQVFAVARFVEKPDLPTAQAYLSSGEYLWNSGMFLVRADVYLSELERLKPQILAQCRAALEAGTRETDFFRVEARSFEACESISIDNAVMEHTARAAVIPVEMGWSDIGSWSALWEALPQDSDGNVLDGDVMPLSTRGSYLRSDGPFVATIGLENIAVIATSDAVLVCARDAAQDVRAVVEKLAREGRDLHVTRPKMTQP